VFETLIHAVLAVQKCGKYSLKRNRCDAHKYFHCRATGLSLKVFYDTRAQLGVSPTGQPYRQRAGKRFEIRIRFLPVSLSSRCSLLLFPAKVLFGNHFSATLFRRCCDGFDFFLGRLQCSFLANRWWTSSNGRLLNALSSNLWELPFDVVWRKAYRTVHRLEKPPPGDFGVRSQRSLMQRSIDEGHCSTTNSSELITSKYCSLRNASLSMQREKNEKGTISSFSLCSSSRLTHPCPRTKPRCAANYHTWL